MSDDQPRARVESVPRTAPVALVTGASGRIGGWITEGLVENGYRVIAVDRAEHPHSDGVGPGGRSIRVDLSDPEAIDRLMDTVDSEFGALDLLINNAGLYPVSDLLDTSVEQFDQVFAVNVRAPFALMRRAVATMRQEGRPGAVVNVGSSASRRIKQGFVTYSASKAALEQLSKGFALEAARHGVRVNTIEPGFIAGAVTNPLSPEYVTATDRRIPLQRQSGKEELVAAVLFLASAQSRNTTGATLAVDGGSSIGALEESKGEAG